MPIEIECERLMTLAQAAAYLTDRGAPRSVSTVRDWAQKGRLETVEIGGILHTSVEALQRHAEGRKAGRHRLNSTATERRRDEQARKELEAAGW